MKKIVILGSTGHIGKQTLEIVKAYPHKLRVVGLTTLSNTTLLKKQAREFGVSYTGVGEKDLITAATYPDADLILVSVVGKAGLLPTIAALRSRKQVALATKEVLVLAGKIVTDLAKKYRTQIIPIDSEHSALFQCMHSGNHHEIKKLHITMGKGSIAKMTKKQLDKVTMQDICNRETWIMGNKITIDSATCVNKSFEIIEAKWLFNIKQEQIDVIVHPEYLCHSLVEFNDGSILGEFGTPDMKRYIQYALFYPQRMESKVTGKINLFGKKITFEKPQYDKFPALRFGHEALIAGGTMPAVLHGADEAAVYAFVNKKIKFTDIPVVIKKTMDKHIPSSDAKIETICKAEEWAKKEALSIISTL